MRASLRTGLVAAVNGPRLRAAAPPADAAPTRTAAGAMTARYPAATPSGPGESTTEAHLRECAPGRQVTGMWSLALGH